MPTNILMPALSPTMEKGNLARWLKKEGDKIKSGDVIAEIETDKATMEYEAVDEGTLAKIVVPAGTQDVAVNAVIAVLAGEGEDVTAAASAAKAALAKAPDKKTEAVTPSPQPSPPRGEGVRPNSPTAPQTPSTSPLGGDVARRSPQGEGVAGEGARASNRIFSSPLARRLAKEGNIDLARVQGSGPHGRVIARDIDAAKTGGAMRAPDAAPATAVSMAATPSDAQIRALYEDGSYDFVPHDSMRKIIAQRLTLSKQTIPHFYLTLDCDIGKLLAARMEINAAAPMKDGQPAYKISVNDFVIKALALALQRVPDANVTWTEGGMLHHKHSDVGVAVAIPGGLITPVVRQAEAKSLSTISNEMKDYAARARTRHLKPHEYQGGSTAISNLGMFGIKDFAAVINPPHATILAVGAGEQRAVVRNGQLAVANIMTVTLSTDHRAVDGALGAEFLSAFKALIENPVMMVV
ncbi:MAG: pyruvate dehydrogenase complex dihydrolipoamide acetyltransferase [Rhizobiales bacterium]|nr:pyruvate dehydrogenase complex dihydrolipoamide acetyltransferase [Hyphomicrobiales bacterium]